MMSRRKHGIFISAPHDGQVYVAERSRRGTPSSCTCSRRPTADSPNGSYGMYRCRCRSLRLDARGPHHLAPFVGFVRDDLPKCLG